MNKNIFNVFLFGRLQVLLQLLAVSFFLVACESTTNSIQGAIISSEDNNEEKVESDYSNFTGTYVGLHGSGITLFENGGAEYYWKEWPDVETGDTWECKDNKLIFHSRSLGYDIYADIEGESSSSLDFKGLGDAEWEDEIFVRVSDEVEAKSREQYISIIEKQLNTTLKTDNDEGAEAPESIENDESEGDEVSEDLKKFLDDYEAFIDEYVDFLDTYNKNPDDLSLLLDYADMMKKYSEFAETADKYDTSTMSASDSKYYIEVTSRCSKKMLEAAGN